MNSNSIVLSDEQLTRLKQLAPQVFKDEKPNADQLLEFILQKNTAAEKYELNFFGKSAAIESRHFSGDKKLLYDPELSIDGNKSNNLFIEADNIDALELLQENYTDKIKMICIDPPYNTGSDTFIYADKFHSRNQAEVTPAKKGKKAAGKDPGQVHSNWLAMMQPRLALAHKLLNSQGVIFVSIDDHEVYAIKLLLDEIFGEKNFLGNIIWNSTKSVTNTALLSVSHTHNLVYVKDIEYFKKNRTSFRLPDTPEGFSNPDEDERGPWKADPFQVEGERPNQMYEIRNPVTGKIYTPNPGCSWKNDLEKFSALMKEGRIVFGASGLAGPQRKRFLSEAMERGRVSKSLWTDIETTSNGTTYLERLVGKKIFTNPKPLSLIQRFIQLGTVADGDVVLDFFGGSGTTAEAVLRQNREDGKHRNFIIVTLPEVIDAKTQAGKNALSLGCKTITDVAYLRLTKTIEDLSQQALGEDLGLKYFTCK